MRARAVVMSRAGYVRILTSILLEKLVKLSECAHIRLSHRRAQARVAARARVHVEQFKSKSRLAACTHKAKAAKAASDRRGVHRAESV